METRFLRYFLTVAEELHFRKAAEKLHMSQPPLSQQIMKLEKELGVDLFIRTKRSVSLTQAGKRLQVHARNILSLMESAKKDVQETARGKTGSLSLGYVGPAMDGFLPGLLKRFKKEFPGVDLQLRQMTSRGQISGIRNGVIHAGVVRLFGQTPDHLEALPVHEETYVLAVPDGHGLAQRKKVRIPELSHEPMIFFPRQSQPKLFDAWMGTFAEQDMTPRITQEAESYQTTTALVSAGLGVAIVPEATAKIKRPGVAFIPLQGKKPELILHLCYLQGSQHPVLKNLLEGIKS